MTGRGTDSSRSSRTLLHQSCGFFKRSNGLFPRNCWKMVEKALKRITSLDIVEQRLNRDPRAAEHRCPAHDVRVAVNYRFFFPPLSHVFPLWGQTTFIENGVEHGVFA